MKLTLSLVIICGLKTAIHAFSLSVLFPPPPAKVDDRAANCVQDELGYLHEVDVDKVMNEPLPYFSLHQGVMFELFTPKNPKEPQLIQFGNATSLKATNFNKRLPTRIVIHGWYSEGVLTPQFADAYFEKGKHKVNFIAVNWQKGSDVVNYIVARRRVNMVAEYVAKFIDFLVEHGGMRLKDLTAIGHSLGAHVSGIAGKKVTKGKISKIVGLDPASPLFKNNDIDDRLDATDAHHVEVIHTSAGMLAFSRAIGTVDFYPNGGKSQPGCGWDISGACSHRRAYEFYLESIYNSEFHAFECDSFDNLQKGNCSVVNKLQQMGGEPGKNTKAKGIFYLQTNEKATFGQGRRGILKSVMLSAKDDAEKMRSWNFLYSKKDRKTPIAIVDNNAGIFTRNLFKSKKAESVVVDNNKGIMANFLQWKTETSEEIVIDNSSGFFTSNFFAKNEIINGEQRSSSALNMLFKVGNATAATENEEQSFANYFNRLNNVFQSRNETELIPVQNSTSYWSGFVNTFM